MSYAIKILLIVVAIIHLIPVTGVLGAARLSAIYGISFQEPNLVILMRHRALLFGLLGCFLLYAAFVPQWQPMAFVAGFVSVVSFLLIAWQVGGYNQAIYRVVLADIVALVCLLVAVILYYTVHHKT